MEVIMSNSKKLFKQGCIKRFLQKNKEFKLEKIDGKTRNDRVKIIVSQYI